MRGVGLHLLGLLGVVEGFPVASDVMRIEAVRVYASFAFGAPIDRQGTLDGGMALGTLVQNLGLGLLVPGLVKVSSVWIALRSRARFGKGRAFGRGFGLGFGRGRRGRGPHIFVLHAGVDAELERGLRVIRVVSAE